MIASGTRIGPYEISGALGAGGMGEVYRARDTRLDRDVAIKILPPVFAADPDRLARFEREAKTLASLNHPNIAQIFGIEEVPDPSGDMPLGRLSALVMELVEGESLAARIARGPVAVDETASIARQMADALEAAHESGIVHRDLKPANVMVRADGTVKVLDFGLAKAPVVQSSPSLMNSPTVTSPAMTAMGVILGTAGYMSPEQARGRPVDKRSDIWAFGVVLYEMLTGTTLFAGETVSDVLAAVLRADIDVASVPAHVPASTRRLLARCLEKDPRRRLRDIGEARIILESIRAADDDAPLRGSAGTAARVWQLTAAVSAVLAIGLLGWTAVSPRPVAMPVRASIALPAGTEYLLEDANPPNLAISPDGSVVAFSATPVGMPVEASALYLYRFADGATTRVADSAGGRVPFFSPDGRWIAFLAGTTLKKAPVSGGTPTAITTGVSHIWGADWLEDHTIVYSNPSPTGEMLFTVPDAGGEASVLTRLDRADIDHSFPRAVTGSDMVLSNWTGGLYTDARILRFNRRTLSTSLLVDGGSQAEVVGGRHLVFARGTELFVQPFPGRPGETTGVKVLDGVQADLSYATAQFDVSPKGSLVFAPGTGVAPKAVVMWIGLDGRTETLFEDPALEMPRLSGDGQHLIFMSRQETREKDLWAFDMRAGRRARITNVRGEEYNPAASFDAQVVYFVAWRERWGMYRTSRLGGAETQLSVPGDRAIRPWSVSKDGRLLAVSDDMPGGAFDRVSSDIGVVDLTSDTVEPRWLTNTPYREDRPAFSPDGTQLAYVSNQLGRPDVWVMAVAGQAKPEGVPVSRDGGFDPFWSPDGRTLYFTAGAALVAASSGSDGRFREPRKVLDLQNMQAVGIGADGRFLVVRRERQPITRLEILLNWLTLLDQRGR